MTTTATQDTAEVTGRSIIAGVPTLGSAGTHQPVDPRTNTALAPHFGLVGPDQVDLAARAAADCFDEYRSLSVERRAEFLDAAADELESIRAELVARATQETGLPEARIAGEVSRTSGQLRLFAREIRLGAFHAVRHDSAQPDRSPAPRPDIRLRRIPLGPVAVFGASNFPLAFSTAGGDTASALAAGCPVVVKGHSAHAGTAELAGQAIHRAAARTGMPAGVFSLLFGSGREVGQQLAAHPAIAAIGFTGSQAAGTALMATAAARPVPIPVYAEMSSINPVIATADRLVESAREDAEGFIGSLTLGSGQFCTNPGLMFVPRGSAGDTFADAVTEALTEVAGQTMLTSAIRDSFEDGVKRVRAAGARVLAEGITGPGENAPAPVVLQVEAKTLATTPDLHEEVFGAAAIIVSYSDEAELRHTLEQLGGQLTITLRITDSGSDADFVAELLPTLERCAGRILVNGWPTGVEVVDSMVHGGPFPATSDSRATSVGTLAIERFLRPVAYQNFPEALLPEVFRDPQLPRRVDGVLR